MIQSMQAKILLLLVLCLFSSCRKKTASCRELSLTDADTFFKQSVAVIDDDMQPSQVPLPFGMVPVAGYNVNHEEGNDSFAFACTTPMGRLELINFYRQTMEQDGWRLVSAGDMTNEYLFVWEKPSTIAVISIRCAHGKQCMIVVYLSQKSVDYL